MICGECGAPVDEGNHGACWRVMLAKLAAAVADKTRLESQLQDAGILTRRR